MAITAGPVILYGAAVYDNAEFVSEEEARMIYANSLPNVSIGFGVVLLLGWVLGIVGQRLSRPVPPPAD